MINNTMMICRKFLHNSPSAVAVIKGNDKYRDINGKVMFYNMNDGVVVVAEIYGLPHLRGACNNGVFGFHIHTGNECTGTANDPFANTKGHFNPNNCPHPKHSGDLPPLFENNGFAWFSFYTERFKIRNIIGRTIIIHSKADDFTTQPSGNSGEKIACGIIK